MPSGEMAVLVVLIPRFDAINRSSKRPEKYLRPLGNSLGRSIHLPIRKGISWTGLGEAAKEQFRKDIVA